MLNPVIKVTPSSAVQSLHGGDDANNNGSNKAKEDQVNPWIHRFHWNFLQGVQIAIMSVTIAPLRLILFVVSKFYI